MEGTTITRKTIA